MEEPAQENQNNAAGGVGSGAGAENAPGAAAAEGNNNNGGTGNIETESSSENGNAANADGGGIVAAGEGTAAAPASSRYPQRKRKPLLLSAGDSNSNSAAQPADGLVDPSALTDRQFEKLLAQYEADGEAERAQKKLRLERGYGDDDYPYVAPPEGCPPLDSLPKEAVKLVFELLPTVRSVFNLAFQSKYMLSFVEERVSSRLQLVSAAVWGSTVGGRLRCSIRCGCS